MPQVDLCQATELHPCEVDGRADAGRPEGCLVRVRLQPSNQLGERVDRQFAADDECKLEFEDLGDRQQVDKRIVAEARIDMRMDREQAVWAKKQSCSVRSRVLDGAKPDSPAGARSVLDDHRPAEALL